MAEKNAWPTATDLTNRLSGLGASLPGGYAAQDLIDEAISQFEGLTGIKPFLASNTASARKYDPTGNAFLSIDTAAAITEVKVDELPLVLDDDYFLSNLAPHTIIQFAEPWYGTARDFTVTAKWGYSLTIPLDAWNAVLDHAVGLALEKSQIKSAAASGLTGAITEVRQADVTIKSGGNADSFTVSSAQKMVAVAKRYKAVKI